MTETVGMPKSLLKELQQHLTKIDEILATLEELMDKEGVERIRRATDEYRRGEYVTAEKPKTLTGSCSKSKRPLGQHLSEPVPILPS